MSRFLVNDSVQHPLYVIAPIFNPIRYKSRWKHYERFARYVVDSGAILVTVEAAFGERDFALEDVAPQHEAGAHSKAPKGTKHLYVKLRVADELWTKEALINAGVARLPPDWKYVAWVDADVSFTRPNWVGETIHQLQHYSFVQMFRHAQDVGPNYDVIAKHRGFVDMYLSGEQQQTKKDAKGYAFTCYRHGHPGYAWAATREAFEAVGGLMEFAILGAGDNHMAHALIGMVDYSVHPRVSADYLAQLHRWQDLAERYIRRNVGMMDGLLIHYWHGKKADRRYKDRWQILVEHGYEPSRDLKRNAHGIPQFRDTGNARHLKIRDEIRAYFRARSEDSIDVA